MITKYIDHFSKTGYVIAPGDKKVVEDVRERVSKEIMSLLAETGIHTALNSNEKLDDLHKFALDAVQLNDLRVSIVKRLAPRGINELIFNAFAPIITALLGPDILVQKHTNLVIQVPNDPNPSELHRDAPPNSEYELVAWVPLVDIDEQMAMYILDLSASKRARASLADATSWLNFKESHVKAGSILPIAFGQGLFFWTGLFHGSDINRGARTRVSLNIRFKAVGSPFGNKAATQFFKILTLSPLTRMGLDSELNR